MRSKTTIPSKAARIQSGEITIYCLILSEILTRGFDINEHKMQEKYFSQHFLINFIRIDKTFEIEDNRRRLEIIMADVILSHKSTLNLFNKHRNIKTVTRNC